MNDNDIRLISFSDDKLVSLAALTNSQNDYAFAAAKVITTKHLIRTRMTLLLAGGDILFVEIGLH